MNRSGLLVTLGIVTSGCLSSSPNAPGRALDAGLVWDASGSAGGSLDGAPGLDAGTAACGNPPSGPTTHGGSVNTETWTAAGSPHIVPYDTTVYGTLTIEPCAEVLLAPLSTVTVAATGHIFADGTASKPIHIGPRTAGKPFAQIRSSGATLRFAYTTIEGGGDPLNTAPDYAGMIGLQGTDGTLPTQEVIALDHVTLSGSGSNGIVLTNGAGFSKDSSALTITGAKQYPVHIWSRAVGTLPPGAYTGNTHDEILISATGLSESMLEDQTMHARGVPYHIGHSGSGGDMRLGGGTTLATLTIEPGVTLRFKKGGDFQIEHFTGTNPASGALIAVGTAALPIVFTSAEPSPAAGDWLGLDFGGVPNPNDRIDFARVEYAGGKSTSGSNSCTNVVNVPYDSDAAIRIYGPPSSQFVTNTTILASAANGIDRGWRDDTLIDFLSSNQFQVVALCNQTYPAKANNACPAAASVPCPK